MYGFDARLMMSDQTDPNKPSLIPEDAMDGEQYGQIGSIIFYDEECLNDDHYWHEHGGDLNDHKDSIFVNICLNANYEGGEFMYREHTGNYTQNDTNSLVRQDRFYFGKSLPYNGEKKIKFTRPGQVVTFPSNMEHAVTKKTKGVREHLVLVYRIVRRCTVCNKEHAAVEDKHNNKGPFEVPAENKVGTDRHGIGATTALGVTRSGTVAERP